MDLPNDRNLTNWTVPKDTSAVCDGIPVLWQNTDVQILALLGLTPTSASLTTGSQTSIATPTSTSINSSTSTPSGSSLSSGAKAAIGVTIPLALIALIAGIFIFFRRRNSRQSHLHNELPTSAESDSGNWTHLGFLKYGQKQKANELDSARVFEADEGNQIVEMGDGRDHLFEMADTSSMTEGGKDTKKRDTPSDARGDELQRKKEAKRGNDGQDLLMPEQGHSGGNSELEIDTPRESAPPSYTK